MISTMSLRRSSQPIASLDELIGKDANECVHYIRRRDLESVNSQNPLSKVPIETVIAWCKSGGPQLWTNVATVIPAFDKNPEDENLLSWSESAIMLITHAPKPIDVVLVLVDRISPTSWSGSRADIMAARLPLLNQLSPLLTGDDLTALIERKVNIQRTIDREKQRECDDYRARNERFE